MDIPLFIDYNIILKNKYSHYYLKNNYNNRNICTIIITDKNTLHKFYNINKVETLDKEWFKSSIKYITHFLYNENKDKAELISINKKYINYILKGFMYYMPPECIIYIKPENNQDISFYRKIGFNISPNKKDTFLNIKNTYFKKSENCSFKFYFTKNAIDFLENTSKNGGSTLNKDKSVTQKEISGGFIIKDEKRDQSKKMIYGLDIDKSMIISNREEKADIPPSLYNFHTHPFQAYIKHNVKLAWPSSDDYLAFLYSIYKYNTIFHLIASIEGIYVISINEYWCKNWKDIGNPNEWIKKIYKIRYIKEMTINKYLIKINEKEFYYKGKSPIFDVKFSKWDNIGIFKVYFPSKNNICKIK